MSSLSSTIGNVFILGFRGPQLPSWLIRFASRFGLGGVILFDYDVKTGTYENNILDRVQLTTLCAELHALPGRPLVYVDQEGGKVRRLKEKLGFSPLPSAKKLAQFSPAEALSALRIAFREMREIGFDVDLAPVIDLDTNPDNPDIGKIERSASADRVIVAKYAEWFESVSRETGLGLCLKHYPGLGGATTNSHQELTEIAEPDHIQLDLFSAGAAKMRWPAILVSHAICRAWSDEPISVCKDSLSRLRSLAPEALLLTDDLQMQGMQKRYGTEQAVYRALTAGNDAVLIGNNLLDEQDQLESLTERLVQRLENDSGERGLVTRSVDRILARKKALT